MKRKFKAHGIGLCELVTCYVSIIFIKLFFSVGISWFQNKRKKENFVYMIYNNYVCVLLLLHYYYYSINKMLYIVNYILLTFK